MEQVITAKVRLYPTKKRFGQFKAVTREYRDICNIVSQWYFDNRFKAKRK